MAILYCSLYSNESTNWVNLKFVGVFNILLLSSVEQLVKTLIAAINIIRILIDLKAFYKQKLRADSEEGSKGAGVGLIEIARKSSEFDFDFIDLNDGTSFFLLRSILK